MGLAGTTRPATVQATNTVSSEAPPLQPQNVDNAERTTPLPTLVAGQPYPWHYMTSTLDACFQSNDLTETQKSELAGQATGSLAERAADALFAQTAPRIMQTFHAHGDACGRVEAEALQLASNPISTGENEDEDWDAPLRVYAEMLDTLEHLHTEALELEESILDLTHSSEPSSPTASVRNSSKTSDTNDDEPAEHHPDAESEAQAQAQILGVFRACLPVLRARIANLSMAQELVDGARENTSISLRMESLGLLD